MLSFIIISLLLIGSSDTCTEFILRGNDASITLGRTMDFDITLDCGFYVEPMGTEYRSFLNNVTDLCQSKAIQWVNRYKIIAIRPVVKELNHVAVDGINEHGITASCLYLPGYTVYDDVCKSGCANTISQGEVVGYILGTFKNVDEVKDAINSGKFPCVAGNVDFGMVQPVHYAVTDKNGGAIVIEYTKEGRMVYENTIRVMTNSPTYDWHMTNIKTNFLFSNKMKPQQKYKDAKGNEHVLPRVAMSSLVGLPGDYTAHSRLLRTAAMVHLSKVPETSEEAVMTSFHIINSVALTKGVEEGRVFPVFTYWQLVKDLTNKCLYYKTYYYLSIRKICLEDAKDHSFLPLDGTLADFKDSVKDVTNELKVTKDEL